MKRSSASAAFSKSFSRARSVSGHKHSSDRSHSQNRSSPNVLQLFLLYSVLFLWPLSNPSSPPFPFTGFPLRLWKLPSSLSAALLSSLHIFFQVVINKNPCERWLYPRDRAEGMEFITRFDWVTPRLSSRSKQLLDFHSLSDLPPFPLLCAPLHKTLLFLLPTLTSLPSLSSRCVGFLSDVRSYLRFVFLPCAFLFAP